MYRFGNNNAIQRGQKDMSKKTELRILGLSSAEIRGEVYVLILAYMGG